MQDEQDQQPATAASPAEPEPRAATPPVAAPQPAAAYPVEPVRVSAAPAPRKGAGSGRLVNLALGAAMVLAIAGVAFAVGRFTAPAAVTAGNFPNGGPGGQFFRNGQGGQYGGPDGRGAFFQGGGVTIEGTVESVSATSMTVKTASGQTIEVALTGSTTYHAQSDATASDVTTGGRVLVRLQLGGGFANGGPSASRNPGGGASASDVTVVP